MRDLVKFVLKLSAVSVLIFGGGAVAALLALQPDQKPTFEQNFLAELKTRAGCDPTTMVPMEQLEIRLTRTTDSLIAVCERYVPSYKIKPLGRLRVGDCDDHGC